MNNAVIRTQTSTSPYPSTKLVSGVGMVEVLVALVVLGVGMLGIASLYITTLQAKTTSLSRTQAVYLANDLADRIRANPGGVTSYDTSVTTSPVDKGCVDSAVAPAVDCVPSDMAVNDLSQWQNTISQTLPGSPTGKVTVISGTPATYTIVISWSERTTSVLTYTLQVQT